MNLQSLDRWLTTPPEPECVGQCLKCKDEIFQGEEVYHVPDGYVCEDCFVDYATNELGAVLSGAE